MLRRSLSASAHFVHYRGAPLFLGTVTKDSTWHPHSSLPRSTDSSKFWCPFLWDRCQLRLGGRPAAQEPGRPGGHSHWPGWEPREQEQRPYRPLFHLHLLCLLLLPPATRSVTTGSDWPGCPAKERDRGETTRNNFPRRRRARRWSPLEGPAPSLHVAAAAAAAGLGAGRGRRLPGQPVAGRIAQYSGRGRGRGRAPG